MIERISSGSSRKRGNRACSCPKLLVDVFMMSSDVVGITNGRGVAHGNVIIIGWRVPLENRRVIFCYGFVTSRFLPRSSVAHRQATATLLWNSDERVYGRGTQ